MDYSFVEFERDIEMGHEIEFRYKGKVYININAKDGYGFRGDLKDFVYYKTPQELLDNGTINGKKLRDIWDEVEGYMGRS
ncbi:hypothetical protein [Neobacillus sp.]|uniref:hypothetical protein n=1 Tax=Neobacillus sp. TaxID=2675273 RepID=UPI0028A25DC1|nr:hypothetical protein [Neobacillus sp.]